MPPLRLKGFLGASGCRVSPEFLGDGGVVGEEITGDRQVGDDLAWHGTDSDVAEVWKVFGPFFAVVGGVEYGSDHSCDVGFGFGG